MPIPANDRFILHLDADAFFASVEQRDDPKLRGKPVAVGTGVVASCSYESRRWGVRTGMRLAEARRLCRSLIVIPGDYRRYEQTARHVYAICHDQTPLVEVAALDDLYLDLTGKGEAERVADELYLQVREEVGLNISIGIAANKLVAKIATKDAKQRKQWAWRGAEYHTPLVHVPVGAERGYLAPWPVGMLTGAGGKIAARLKRLNVRSIGEVAAMPVGVLCGLFGDRGRVLHEQALGIDPRPVEPHQPPQSVSRCTSFDPPVGDDDFLQAMLDHLLERAVSWLRFNFLATRGLTVTIRYGDYEGAEGRESFRALVDDDKELKAAARHRFQRLYQRRLPLRLIGIALTPLAPADRQPMLFLDPHAERQRRLAACKDAIRQRFGFMAVVSGESLLLAERIDHDRENYRLRTPCLTR